MLVVTELKLGFYDQHTDDYPFASNFTSKMLPFLFMHRQLHNVPLLGHAQTSFDRLLVLVDGSVALGWGLLDGGSYSGSNILSFRFRNLPLILVLLYDMCSAGVGSHRALAVEAAAKSTVLLKNTNKLLPLGAGAAVASLSGEAQERPRSGRPQIAVVGPFARW